MSDAAAADLQWLQRAVELGRRGWGRVHPNPMVGCVLVRDDRVLAEGWHARFGGPHAEAAALEAVEHDAEGATAYVSLEPCDHHGKTPPCSQALIRAGVSRVVFGAADPGRASGGGHATLEAAGIEVRGPLFDRRRALEENPAFFRRAEGRTPFVALKLAVSSDGMIASAPGRRTTITGPEASAEVQRLRAGFDGILVGSGTALVDDPLLTVRGAVEPRTPPVRVVLDARGRLPVQSRLLDSVGEAPLLVLTSAASGGHWRATLQDAGAEVKVLAPARDGVGLQPKAVLAHLADRGLDSVLVEGGAEVAGSLLGGELVDRLWLFRSSTPLGPEGVRAAPPRDAEATRLVDGFLAGDAPEGWRQLGPELPFGADAMSIWARGD